MLTRTILAHLSAVSLVASAFLRHQTVPDLSRTQHPLIGQDDRVHAGPSTDLPSSLEDVLAALSTMQDTYYSLLAGTWPDAIDWTAAVMGTHVSATLSSIVSGLSRTKETRTESNCVNLLGWDNLVNKYFAQTSAFYFGENAFGLRHQAYDDMLWVVLGWLENVKFTQMYTTTHWKANTGNQVDWHGVQFAPLAAHRARIFYDLAEQGWDESLCGGGMLWNPQLEPYKNAITNELFAAASIAMYLYFPGDNNTIPFQTTSESMQPHDPTHLGNAVKSYKWLIDAHLRNDAGLYQDGFHITGWQKHPDGTIDPGTGQCDSLDTMVYTYNQGVLLTASRGLWLATGREGYLDDGHELISKVIAATGWGHNDRVWRGLGRSGIMEEFCDHDGSCSQDGQTFKGIFFHHLAEFCRPLWSQEEELTVRLASNTEHDDDAYQRHLSRCRRYGAWIDHNADAVLLTRTDDGLFGMWWGIPSQPWDGFVLTEGSQTLPPGATDWRNPNPAPQGPVNVDDWNDRGRGRTVETQSGGLAVLRARWQWHSVLVG